MEIQIELHEMFLKNFIYQDIRNEIIIKCKEEKQGEAYLLQINSFCHI